MTFAEYASATSPKIQGTLNLHYSLLSLQPNRPLDFFVLFSSQNGLHGWYGQANYAAGNAFQDAFVQYRHSQGLRASVLDIGPVEDVGFVSERPDVASKMHATFPYFTPERELLDALELAIHRSHPPTNTPPESSSSTYVNSSQIIPALHPTIPSTSSSSATAPWSHDPRFSLYTNLSSSSPTSSTTSSTDTALTSFISSIASDPSQLYTEHAPAFISAAIAAKISTFLLKDGDDEASIDVSLSLANVGVDSLVAIELRNWWRRALGLDISVLEILDGGSITRLAEVAVEGLGKKFEIVKD
jgi:hypothetical protein